MLFNTHFFIFIFLPLSLIVFHTLSKLKLHHLKFEFLIIASLFFYSWWSPKYLFLLLGSISANYILGKWILKKRNRKRTTMENELKTELKVEKVNLKQMKQKLAVNQQFIAALKQNQLGQQAWAKYETSRARFRDPNSEREAS